MNPNGNLRLHTFPLQQSSPLSLGHKSHLLMLCVLGSLLAWASLPDPRSSFVLFESSHCRSLIMSCCCSVSIGVRVGFQGKKGGELNEHK